MKIGLWAGSSPASTALFKKGLAHFRRLGWTAVVPAATRKGACRKESTLRPFLAGTDQDKVKAFLQLWQDSRLRDIFGVRGGYGTLRLLPHLEKVKLQSSRPKRIWGFSDFTVIQNYLYDRCGASWVHSPFSTSRAFFETTRSEDKYWKKILSGKEAQLDHNLECLNGPKSLRIKAPMIGGNLASFVTLLGTRWEPRPKKKYILFLEDIAEPPYKVDRMLTQLAGSQLFNRCAAVVLGHFTECERAEKICAEWAKEHQVPLFAGLKAGHDRPNLPIWMGVDAILTHKNRQECRLLVPNPKLEC